MGWSSRCVAPESSPGEWKAAPPPCTDWSGKDKEAERSRGKAQTLRTGAPVRTARHAATEGRDGMHNRLGTKDQRIFAIDLSKVKICLIRSKKQY